MTHLGKIPFALLALGMLSSIACDFMGAREQVGSELAQAGSSAGGAQAGAGEPAPVGDAGFATATGGAGTTAAARTNCLYPSPLVEPLTGDANVSDYVASSPFPVGVSGERWGGLGGVLDVNGDSASDLIFLDRADSSYGLLVSSPASESLVHQEVTCDALDELPVGRMFLRDLDGDGAADFVIGLQRGIVAYRNHPDTLEQILDFQFAGATVRAELINLDTIDLNGDGRRDLVASYDRLQSEATSTFDTGVLGFVQGADGRFVASGSVTSNWDGAALEQEPYGITGYFAAGHFRSSGAPSVLVAAHERGGEQAVAIETNLAPGVAPTPVPIAERSEPVYAVFALPRADGLDGLAVVGDEALHVLDLREGAAVELFSVPLAHAGGLSHELGGGSESPRYYFFDIDSDGDKDFLERSLDLPRRLTLHVNLANAAFAAPQVLPVGVASSAEAPFVSVGAARGVVDEVPDSADQGAYRGTPTIYTLVSGGTAE